MSADYAGADIVLVNTCGFLDSAKEESLQAIGEAIAENGRVIVTGCMGEEADAIRAAHPQVLAVTGAHQYEQVVEAVHEAAAAVANLAQLGREAESEQIAKLPLRAAELSGWRFETIARGIDDLAAIMQPGLRALLSLTARGQDTTAAALTLWREFHASRSAIVDLAFDDPGRPHVLLEVSGGGRRT